MNSSKTELPNLAKVEDDSLKNRLETSSNWSKLTDLQKKIVYTHFLKPELDKKAIALEVGCNIQTVYHVFTTPVYQFITLEMDKLELKELRQLAIKALRECLQSTKDIVKLNAATTLLQSEGLVIKDPVPVKDTDFTVRWGDPDGNQNTLPATPKAD